MPVVDGVTLSVSPVELNTVPGTPVTATITLQDVGNVPETVSLATTLPSGLTASSLSPVTLAVGQTTTETITLTPDASTPLNTFLQATLTATYGPSASPATTTVQIPVHVVVPGALAIAQASVAAGQLGETSLANMLNDLGIALTDLVQNPGDPVAEGQTLADLKDLITQLSADAFLSAYVPAIAASEAAIASASTSAATLAAVDGLGNALDTLAGAINDEAAYGFTLALNPNSQVAQPQTPTEFPVELTNNGTATETYDLSLGSLPDGVTGSFNQDSVTLAPGRATNTAGAPGLVAHADPDVHNRVASVQLQGDGRRRGRAGDHPDGHRRLHGPAGAGLGHLGGHQSPLRQRGYFGGGLARVLNAVNQEQQALVSYVVTGPGGQTVFTSQPVATTLTVLTSLTTVALGDLNTTGFAAGDYTIAVSVTTASGQPIPGATGQGTLLIGSPVTASLSSSPTSAPPGSVTVTNTLQISGQSSSPSGLSLVGQVQTTGGGMGFALDGTIAYVGDSGGISVVDVSNPANPTILGTVGASNFTGGAYTQLSIEGDVLSAIVVNITNTSDIAVVNFSLANPDKPQYLGDTLLDYYFPYHGLATQNNHVYFSIESIYFPFLVGYALGGDLISVDNSNPADPVLADGLSSYGNPAPMPYGGMDNVWQLVPSDPQTLLVTGGAVNGSGQLMVVSTQDPSEPKLSEDVAIPNTADTFGIALDGNLAVVLGSTGGHQDNGVFAGDLVVATLDVSNPEDPEVIATQVTNIPSSSFIRFLVPLGDGQFAAGGDSFSSPQQSLVLINASNPDAPVATQVSLATAVGPEAAAGGLLYATGPSGMLIYDDGWSDRGIRSPPRSRFRRGASFQTPSTWPRPKS